MINHLLNKSFIDNHVSDDESKKNLNKYQEYIRCENIKDVFIERTLVEKANMKEDVDKVFEKYNLTFIHKRCQRFMKNRFGMIQDY